MNNRGDPPDPERVGAECGNSAPANQRAGAGGRFASENTGSTSPRQSRLASVDEAAEILGEYLPEYRHHESSDWSDGENWRLNRASEKQIACLRNSGIDARGANCGHASRLIGKLIKRQQKGLASFCDVLWLHRHGVKNARKLTSHEARQLIEIIGNNLLENEPGDYLPLFEHGKEEAK
jgi:hypothetical protein